MQIDFFIEGNIRDADEFEKWLQTRVFNLPVEAGGKKGFVPLQAGLRVRRAYSFVFPREYKDVVLNTIPFKDRVNLSDSGGKYILKNIFSTIRKLLRLKPLPKPDPKAGMFPMREDILKNLRIIGLGLREEPDFVNEAGTKQEKL